MGSKLFRLFLYILSSIDLYVWEPLFWLLMLLFLSGIEQISDIRKGIIYTPKKHKMINAASLILIAILLFWWYWLKPSGLDKLISM